MRARVVGLGTGIVAIGSKELRGRMRGPRAFIAISFYLALLAGFTFMVYLIAAQAAVSQAAFGGGNPYVSAQVGQSVFTVLLFLQVLLVVFLAPAATSGAISLEREKQTLELLAATPVSTLAIVVGKLASALAFVVVLILASVPLTAIVFVFGGVAPEDILRGYVVLLVTALGFGSVGLLLSSLTRRTQSATVLTYLAVLVLTVGTGFTWYFWDRMAGQQAAPPPVMRDLPAGAPADEETGVDGTTVTPTTLPRPPEALLWLNPVVAAADVVCGMDVNPASDSCRLIAGVTGADTWGNGVGTFPVEPVPGPEVIGGVAQPGIVGDPGRAGLDLIGANVAVSDPFAAASTRDSFWPQSAAAWLVTSAILVLVAVQCVSPTRRWHVLRRRPRRGVAP